MKKGLLLSLIASTAIFAGGDIAPVEPAAAAPAANCSDFSGIAGLHYAYPAKTLYTDVTLKVKHQMGHGVGFGATLYGVRDILGVSGKASSLEELYLTYALGNTNFTVGRFKGVEGISVENDSLIPNTDLTLTYAKNNYKHGKFTPNANKITLDAKYSISSDTKVDLAVGYGITSKNYDITAVVSTKLAGTNLALGGKFAKDGDYLAAARVGGEFSTFKWGIYAINAKGATFNGKKIDDVKNAKAVVDDTVAGLTVGTDILSGTFTTDVHYAVKSKNLAVSAKYKMPVWGNVDVAVTDTYTMTVGTANSGSNAIKVDATYKF